MNNSVSLRGFQVGLNKSYEAHRLQNTFADTGRGRDGPNNDQANLCMKIFIFVHLCTVV